MDFSKTSDRLLEANTHRLVKQELASVFEGILHFCELVKRRIHLRGKHSSLFAYMMGMGFTRDQALVRNDAVLLLVELPELRPVFVQRQISMSALHHMRQIFRREQRRRRKAKLEPLPRSRKLEVARELVRNSSRDTRRMLADLFPECHVTREVARPVAHGLTEITFSCTEEELRSFEELKDLMGHKNYERSWQVFFADLASEALKRRKKSIDLEKVGTADRSGRGYRSVHTERFVRQRAGDQCEHVDPVTGERCPCKHALQIDHIIPLALGGKDHPDNMRLLCGPHNRFAAWRMGLRRPGEELHS